MRVTLLATLAVTAGCAAVQDPPGGPPDFTPPVLLSTVPDSGSVVPDLRDDAFFQFDEVISERSGGGLEQLFVLSPRPEELKVSWKRQRIGIKPDGGWQPNRIYHLTLLPGIADLSNNRLADPVSIVFSTGGPIPGTRIDGTVVDWEEGRAAPRSLIEAVLLPDSLVYTAIADSVGEFVLGALPQGEYVLYAVVDGNTNHRRDRREPYDSTSLTLDSIFSGVFYAVARDTTGPALRGNALLDSMTVRIEFNQKLRPGDPDSGAVTVRQLPDSIPVAVGTVMLPAVYDSVRTAEAAALAAAAAAADTLLPDSVVRDTAAVGDTVPPPVADSVAPALDRGRAAGLPLPGEPAAQDTSRVAQLLAARPRLVDRWIVRLIAPLEPGGRYVIDARATNVNGAVNESRTLLIVPDTSSTTP